MSSHFVACPRLSAWISKCGVRYNDNEYTPWKTRPLMSICKQGKPATQTETNAPPQIIASLARRNIDDRKESTQRDHNETIIKLACNSLHPCCDRSATNLRLRIITFKDGNNKCGMQRHCPSSHGTCKGSIPNGTQRTNKHMNARRHDGKLSLQAFLIRSAT